ncbi:hypothetical protein [Streptomyces tirandamycinicus]|uniref:Uncharacterized protein n=1 Tax=Streptomyces tirandamycinicus TaxID=2174846 RepID=A0A2S1T1W3_9ACTN|nr:hypothetical protein [Streptomyces tirandamycinicus]AWI32640.1 hypothetical protein DDW44_30440 [Streptomyces tirandamycinicus]
MTTVAAPSAHAIARPLDATATAYALSNADRDSSPAPVSGALLRSLLASALHSRGAAAVEPDTGTVLLTFGQIACMAPAELGPVFRAVPCERPPLTPCCARCGHWKGEHDNPAAPTACTRYRLSIGPARYSMPDHDGVTYAWVRRMGRSRVVFQVMEPSVYFPGGTLVVHRYPEIGDGPVSFSAHFRVIDPAIRAAFIARARARVRR